MTETKPKRSLPARVIRKMRRRVSLISPQIWQIKYRLPEVPIEDIAKTPKSSLPPIQDDRSLPPIPNFADHDDLSALVKIATSVAPNIVVEIGTGYGNLTANICNQLNNVIVYTVNPPAEEQSGKLVTFNLTKQEIGRVYRAYGFGDRVVQIFKNSKELELAEYFSAPVIDLAIIDGCHDTDYVLNDFYKILPYVRPEGTILLHDTHPSLKTHLVDSYKACMILRQRGFEVFHVQDTWWGMWVNPTQSNAITKSKRTS